MYVLNGNDNILGGESQSILGQFTTDGVLSGTVNLQMFTGGLGEMKWTFLVCPLKGWACTKPQEGCLWLHG